MVNFSFSPSQYYARTPISNQSTTDASVTARQNGGTIINPTVGYHNNIASTVPGTVGYKLPAQNYYNYGVNNLSNYGVQTLKTSLVSTAINTGISNVLTNIAASAMDLSLNRLNLSGLTDTTDASLLDPVNSGSDTAFSDDSEDRVIIYDQTGKFIGQSVIFQPLNNLNGVLFPYTPTIQVSHKASYDPMSLVHTNYVTPQYQHSQVDNISISGIFTANYPAEAEYMVAMLHFFRTVTKMFYGQDDIAGTPPPVLYLDAHGPYAFDHIPVVITNFDYTFPNDVDYISCVVNGNKQKVPTSLQVNLSMFPTYSRNNISNNFGLEKFSSGALIGSKTSVSGYSAGQAVTTTVRKGGWL